MSRVPEKLISINIDELLNQGQQEALTRKIRECAGRIQAITEEILHSGDTNINNNTTLAIDDIGKLLTTMRHLNNVGLAITSYNTAEVPTTTMPIDPDDIFS